MAAGGEPGGPAVSDFKEFRLPAFNQKITGPVVLAIEGPNGAGKTTLSERLSKRLGGVPQCLGTDEAWFAESFKVRMIRDADWFASALFFLSGCFEQMRLLRQQAHPLVIMDRCLWSTLAVHGAEDPARLETLLAMLRPIAGQVNIPHTTLVLEASLATCRARIARKTGSARALDELTSNARFHAREREFYRWLGTQTPGVVFLDVDDSDEEEVASKAIALLGSQLGVAGLKDVNPRHD
jgi:thymidylate kinase